MASSVSVREVLREKRGRCAWGLSAAWHWPSLLLVWSQDGMPVHALAKRLILYYCEVLRVCMTRPSFLLTGHVVRAGQCRI